MKRIIISLIITALFISSVSCGKSAAEDEPTPPETSAQTITETEAQITDPITDPEATAEATEITEITEITEELPAQASAETQEDQPATQEPDTESQLTDELLTQEPQPTEGETSQTAADLIGEWTTADIINNDGETAYMDAEITDGEITVRWVFPSDNTTALYWAGTFIQPTDPGDYTMISVNDHEKTDNTLMGSTLDTKDFTYSASADTISYELTMLGITKTFVMHRK